MMCMRIGVVNVERDVDKRQWMNELVDIRAGVVSTLDSSGGDHLAQSKGGGKGVWTGNGISEA